MCDCGRIKSMTYTWEKSYIIRPKNLIESNARITGKQFQVSWMKPCAPQPNMWHLLSWQYYRQWHCELCVFKKKMDNGAKKQFTKPDLNFNKKRFAKMRHHQAHEEARRNPKKLGQNATARAG